MVRVDGHGADRPEAVSGVEILPGVVEHDEPPVLHRSEGFRQLFVEGVEAGLEGGCILPVDALMLRVQPRQGVGHRPGHHRGVDRVQPQVHVVLAGVMLVTVLPVHVPVFVFLPVGLGAAAVVLVLVVLAFGMSVVVVLVLGVLVVVVLLLAAPAFAVFVIVVSLLAVVVVMLLPRAALPVAEEGDALRPGELEDVCVGGQRFEGLDEERFEALAHPHHDVRALQHPGLGRAHRPGVGRSSARHEKGRPAHPLHDPLDQGMDRRDAHDHGRRIGRG